MVDPAHWNGRYQSAGVEAVSWYEDDPTMSLAMLDAAGRGVERSVIDVGGGASRLVDALLEDGHRDIAVLDLSSVALDAARERVGDRSEVTWIEADVLTWRPSRSWDIWHDRAVLHFLVDTRDVTRYMGTLRAALVPGGTFVIGTFAEDGPRECSGLPVRNYGQPELRALLADADADIVDVRRHVHRTPDGRKQPFNWIAGTFRRSEENP